MNALFDLPTITPLTGPPLIDALLADQQKLTAVERFSRIHEAGIADAARFYRDLLPLEAPQPGEQYAFSVDLDACSGCKACVTACHSLNGLDDSETFRDVGGLAGRDRGGLHVLQHVSTACHHCLEPACLTGCPTRAYDKDPQTGIVRHLDDQCIGCQYCTLMCPYDVPKYNPLKGIVRKCDMCRQRLSDGEAPACVQACPNQAIRIEVVRTDAVRERAASGTFLPHAPDPRLTQPTTRFVTRRTTLRDIEPISASSAPAHAHLPLVVMLVLTQMSIGMFIVAEMLLIGGLRIERNVFVALAVGMTGLFAAVLHLGRPQIAHRAWLGWRTSWMSREIIAFHIWLAAAVGFAVSQIAGALGVPLPGAIQHGLGTLTALTGLAAIFCSAMIYVATKRRFWSGRRTVPRYFITAILLGAAGTVALQSLEGSAAPSMTLMIGLAALARFFAEIAGYPQSERNGDPSLAQAVELLDGPLSHWNALQAAIAMLGGLGLPMVMVFVPQFSAALAIPALVLLLAAELVHRGLFFAACKGPGMPGVQHA